MRRPAVTSLALCAALALAAGLAACGGEGISPIDRDEGEKTLRVLLTDAPFPYDSVESVDLYVASVAVATSADTTAPDGAQWQVIAEPRTRFDLLELQAGTTALLGESTLPAGEYKAVRLVLNTDSSRVIDKRGNPMVVQWQSSKGTVALHALVENPVSAAAGGSIVIDIDVGRSFICPGDYCGNTLIFIPWFRAVNADATGSIGGTVTSGSSAATATALANATVSVLGSVSGVDYVVATGATDAQGRYKVSFLRPGSYEVRVDPPRAAGLPAGVRAAVPVVAGQDTPFIDFLLAPGSATGSLLLSSSGPATISVGDTVFFTAYRTDAGADSSFAVTWSSSDAAVLAVSSKSPRVGAAVGVAPGSATVTATLADGRTATALLTVVERRPVAEVRLTIWRETVAVGDSVTAVAAALDASGQAVPGATFTFTVSDTTVLGVRGVYSGLYFLGHAKKAGTATITATNGDKSASGTVTVQ